jgi:hypothetical protein
VIEPLALALRAAGEHDSSQALLAEGAARAEEAGEVVLAAVLRGQLGYTQVFLGHPAAAVEPLRDAIAVLREAGEPSQVIWKLTPLGIAELIGGDLAAAKRDFRDALTMSRATGDSIALAAAFLGLGFVASAEGRHDQVARLLGVVARLRGEAGGGPLPSEPLIIEHLGDPEGAARRALGDRIFEQRRAEGQAMAMDEAVAYALADDDRGHGETIEEHH